MADPRKSSLKCFGDFKGMPSGSDQTNGLSPLVLDVKLPSAPRGLQRPVATGGAICVPVMATRHAKMTATVAAPVSLVFVFYNAFVVATL